MALAQSPASRLPGAREPAEVGFLVGDCADGFSGCGVECGDEAEFAPPPRPVVEHVHYRAAADIARHSGGVAVHSCAVAQWRPSERLEGEPELLRRPEDVVPTKSAEWMPPSIDCTWQGAWRRGSRYTSRSFAARRHQRQARLPGVGRTRHDEQVNDWLDRLGTWQFVLIVWPGGVLCVLLGYGIPAWLSDARFNLVLLVGLAVVTSLGGLPPMIWQRNRRRRVQ